MSNSWLQSWLHSLNLAEYLDTLSSHGYTTPKSLAYIVERDQLKAIGVNKMGHLSRLIRAIEKLQSDGEGGEGGEDVSSLVSSSVENHDSAPLNSAAVPPLKEPPPIPKRKSLRHFSSGPISPTSPTSTLPDPSCATGGSVAQSRVQKSGTPPPVLPRDQSLKRQPRQSLPDQTMSNNFLSPSSMSRSSKSSDPGILVPLTTLSSANGPTDLNTAASPAKPKALGSPTPKPRQKQPPQPAPRKKTSSSIYRRVSGGTHGGGDKGFKTLPAGIGLEEGRTSSPSLSPPPCELLSSSDSGKSLSQPDVLDAQDTRPHPQSDPPAARDVRPLPQTDPPTAQDARPLPQPDPPTAPRPLPQPDPPTAVRPLPQPVPPDARPLPQPAPTVQDVRPLPQPDVPVSVTRRSLGNKDAIFALEDMPMLGTMESGDEGVGPSARLVPDQPYPALPPKDTGPPTFAPPPLPPERKYFRENSLPSDECPPLPPKATNTLPSHSHPPPFQRRLTPEERVSVMADMASATPPRPPPRSSTLPVHCMLPELESIAVTSETSMRSIGGDTSMQPVQAPPLRGVRSPSPPTEDPPEPPQAYEDSEDEEEDTRMNLISIQSSRALSDDNFLMTQHDAEESGGDTPFSSPMHTGTLIRQQMSSSSVRDHEDDVIMMGGFPLNEDDNGPDYVNQKSIDGEVDDIVMGGSNSNVPDYMNQESIDDDMSSNSGSESENRHVGAPPKRIIVSQRSNSLDEIIGVDGDGADYMNQKTIDELDALDLDYMNQDVIDQTMEDTDKALEYMNQAVIDLVHSEIEEEKAKGMAPGDMLINTTTAFATEVHINDNELYDTEDDLTDDFDEDETGSSSGGCDKLKTSTHKELLQIHGTMPMKTRTMGDSHMDYENQDVVQDVLEGDIIPMIVAEANDGDHSLPNAYPGVQSLSYLGLKTHAEVSSNGQTVSNDSRDEEDAVRASWCSDDTRVSSLDFVCDRPAKVGKGMASSGLNSKSTPYLPILSTTKLRSHTNADVLNSRPHPLGFTTQTNNGPSSDSKPSSLDMDGIGHDPFYIPPVLPKSAGTFAGTQYKKPTFRKLQSTDDQVISRHSLLHDQSSSSSLTESCLLPGFSRLANPEDVPKTNEGFLYKKGGRRNERPWQKRWMIFNGSELKYFKNKLDKDNLCLNTVELEKMIDVKRVQDEVDKQFRFDLVVINRVFQFFSESVEDCQEWVNVLHVAIAKYKPQEHEHKEGGSMHDPNKQGYLQKQGHGPFSSSKFKERYVALKDSKFSYYETHEDFKHGRPIHTLEMTLSSVRPDMGSKLPRFVIITNNQKHYFFQASSDLGRNQWVESLTMAIMTGLDLRPKTMPRGGTKTSNSQVVMLQLQNNFSNKTCADCAAEDPEWGVINRGIMVCIKCSGVHRSFGVHLSKVRSVGLDEEIWTFQDQINLMVQIGNYNSNRFWEHHYHGERLPRDVESEIRENFIRAKYITRSWIPMSTVENKDVLSNLLCENMASDNIMKSIELIALGANTCHLLSDVEDPEKSTPLAIARSSGQLLQAKLLELNGASICRKEDRQTFTVISKKGPLYKTGTDRSAWKRRYCSLDQHRGFEYFKTETDSEIQGYIRVEEMFSVAKSEDDGSRDSKYRHCFEVNTRGRGYLFCADTAEELEGWVGTFEQIINSDAADNLGYDKVGYLKKKDPGWRRLWFTLKGKSLACYKKERAELDEIDLRKVVELKGAEPGSTPDQQCIIQIMTEDKTYHLKAESPAEAESWVSALRHTQVSGIPLREQQLTNSGIPIVIHKCLQFIESIGLSVEGLYRISGEKAKIRKLILAFNQDARGVVIDPEKYTVHDVTGTLKQFLHSLPDPVLTHSLYQNFIATIQSDHEAQMYQIKSLIEQLPDVNGETLKRIIGHLKRVTENESQNKMNISNISRLFGPTLMTTDDGPVSFANTQYEYSCVHAMIKFYKWLFQVAEDENRKDEAIEEAVMKIKELEEAQKKRAEMKSQKKSNITSTTDFLTTVYIGGKLGDTYNMHINGVSTVQGVVEEVVTRKELPPDNYALYLVLGDSESHRVLCFSERLLAVLCSAGTEHYLCLQRNAFWETLNPHFGTLLTGETVLLYVKEKKKWRKYPCCLRDNQFIQFKDSKCHHELFKLGLNECDIFVGIQQSRIDIKNPMPTRHSFWIKATKGDELSRYFCSDSKDVMLKLIAAVVQAKFPSCLRTPVLPENSPVSSPPAYPPQTLEMEFQRPFNTSPPLRS